MKQTLRIAAAVQQDGKSVLAEDVAAAREAGATDVEILDTMLIAAAFCMYNRYVDGLAAIAPDDPAAYAATVGAALSKRARYAPISPPRPHRPAQGGCSVASTTRHPAHPARP